jgi:hypothetical protein
VGVKAFAGIILPTHFRHLSSDEWTIVDHVFGATNLPYRFRVVIADGVGLYDTPFTVPTSAISSALLAAGITNPLLSLAGPVGLLTTPIRMLVGGVAGQGASVANTGYIINVGPTYYPDTTKDSYGKETLVHEMTHVWQGKNNVFALTATLASLAAQCRGMSVSGGYKGRSAAYRYTIGTPPPAWGRFNPEQQANIVQQWYNDSQDPTVVSTTTKELPYVRDYLRQGKTS